MAFALALASWDPGDCLHGGFGHGRGAILPCRRHGVEGLRLELHEQREVSAVLAKVGRPVKVGPNPGHPGHDRLQTQLAADQATVKADREVWCRRIAAISRRPNSSRTACRCSKPRPPEQRQRRAPRRRRFRGRPTWPRPNPPSRRPSHRTPRTAPRMPRPAPNGPVAPDPASTGSAAPGGPVAVHPLSEPAAHVEPGPRGGEQGASPAAR